MAIMTQPDVRIDPDGVEDSDFVLGPPVSEARFVRISDLWIDVAHQLDSGLIEGFQRGIQTQEVLDFEAKGVNNDQFGWITVNERPGPNGEKYSVTEGQQRTIHGRNCCMNPENKQKALDLLAQGGPDKELRAALFALPLEHDKFMQVIVHHVSQKMEAALYYLRPKMQRKMGAIALFYGKLAAGDEVALTVFVELSKRGIDIDSERRSMAINSVRAIARLLKIETNTSGRVAEVSDILLEAVLPPRDWSTSLLAGLDKFLTQWQGQPRYQREFLVQGLEVVEFSALKKEASRIYNEIDMPREDAWRRAITKYYNALIPPRSRLTLKKKIIDD